MTTLLTTNKTTIPTHHHTHSFFFLPLPLATVSLPPTVVSYSPYLCLTAFFLLFFSFFCCFRMNRLVSTTMVTMMKASASISECARGRDRKQAPTQQPVSPAIKKVKMKVIEKEMVSVMSLTELPSGSFSKQQSFSDIVPRSLPIILISLLCFSSATRRFCSGDCLSISIFSSSCPQVRISFLPISRCNSMPYCWAMRLKQGQARQDSPPHPTTSLYGSSPFSL